MLCGLEYVDESQCINVPAVSLDGISLKAVTTQKYPGVIIDHRLTWKFQVAKVCKKMAYLNLVNCHQKAGASNAYSMNDGGLLSFIPTKLCSACVGYTTKFRSD